MAATNELHLLALGVRIGFGGDFQRRDVPSSERASREVPAGGAPAPEHHLVLTLMISPPSTWTDAHDLMEGASECGLIRKAHLIRNIGQ
jgi:hypothetical protein